MNMTNNQLDLEPEKRLPMPHSLLVITKESLERGQIKMLNAINKGHKKAECWAKGGRKEGQ